MSMRIISGTAAGRRLRAPKSQLVRPTLDKVKHAIFNSLGESGGRGRVLELFAGTGALGIEALSRGAEWCDFVDVLPALMPRHPRKLACGLAQGSRGA